LLADYGDEKGSYGTSFVPKEGRLQRSLSEVAQSCSQLLPYSGKEGVVIQQHEITAR
ncbi:hypothetical protein PC120_g26586, partial [Phytophthora cactorum]